MTTALLTLASSGWAAPSMTIHTKDGGTFHGELVERVVDDHITLRLETGEVKRINIADIEPAARAEPPPKRKQSPPTETVHLHNGSMFFGELVERVVGDHVALQLRTGETRRFEWKDIDVSPAEQPMPFVAQQPAPVETVRSIYGDTWTGEVVERVVDDHETLMLSNGDLHKLAWNELLLNDDLWIEFRSDRPMYLQRYAPDDQLFHDLCRSPCSTHAARGTYRVSGQADALGSRSFQLHRDSTVVGHTRSSDLRTAGVLLSVIASISGTIGVPLTFVAPTPNAGSGIPIAAALLDLGTCLTIMGAVILFAESHTTVVVNGGER